MVLGACAIPVQNASAVSIIGNHIDLYNNNVDAENATTDYHFYVGFPDYLSLDQDYWNFTIYGELVNNTGAAASATYTVTLYIDDGATNITAASGNIVMVNSSAVPVYKNISIAAASFATLTEVDAADVYVVLKISSVVKDSWTGEMPISETYTGGIIGWIIPMAISIMVLGLVIGMMTKVFSNMPKFGRK